MSQYVFLLNKILGCCTSANKYNHVRKKKKKNDLKQPHRMSKGEIKPLVEAVSSNPASPPNNYSFRRDGKLTEAVTKSHKSIVLSRVFQKGT